jgi:hypothetical protein
VAHRRAALAFRTAVQLSQTHDDDNATEAARKETVAAAAAYELKHGEFEHLTCST